MEIDEILRELESAWEAGSLPGRQMAEFNAAWRGMWQALQQRPATRAPVRLRPVHSIAD